MRIAAESLRILILESPYENFHSSTTQTLLSEIFRLKLRSYQDVYAAGVLPLDTYDFISTHHLVGVDGEEGFIPLLVYRSTTMEDCLKHHLAFPGVAVLRSSGAEVQAEALERKLREWVALGQRVSYGSGWAIEPSLRNDRVLRERVKELMTAMLVRYEEEKGTRHLVGCGTSKVRSDDHFFRLGYQRMEDRGRDLEPFRQSSLIDVEAIVIYCESFSEYARGIAAKNSEHWRTRWVANSQDGLKIYRKAA